MFDIGFSELVLIGVVALVVIGPERLPRVARTAGLLFGRMQRYVNDVKADIHRELQADELRKLQEEMRASARQLEESVAKQVQEGNAALQAAKEQVHEIVEIPRAPSSAAPLENDAPAQPSEPVAAGATSPPSQPPSA